MFSFRKVVSIGAVIGILGFCAIGANNPKEEFDFSYEGTTAGSSSEFTRDASEALQDVSNTKLSRITDTVNIEGCAPAYSITDADYTMYTTSSLNVRSFPDEEATIVDVLPMGEEVSVVGEIEDNSFVQINHNGTMSYVHSDYISETKPVIQKKSVPVFQLNSQNSYSYSPSASGCLTRSSGVFNGPSGKETYYNLNMSGVVSIMRGMGNNDEYWVRSDGVKMLGPYVMVAADFSIRPRGSLVQTSLGTGLVCDTGTFIYSNPTQIDIATCW